MAESENMAGHATGHANEPAKPEVNRVAELVRPLPAHETGHAAERPSLADLLGIAHPSPSLGDHASAQVAEVEKTWQQKELERREKAGNNGSSGDQSWTERARVLPIEQLQEKENERER